MATNFYRYLEPPKTRRDNPFVFVEIPTYSNAQDTWSIISKPLNDVPQVWRLASAKLQFFASADVANRYLMLDYFKDMVDPSQGIAYGQTMKTPAITANQTFAWILTNFANLLGGSSTYDTGAAGAYSVLTPQRVIIENNSHLRFRTYNSEAADQVNGYLEFQYMNQLLGIETPWEFKKNYY